MTVSEPLPGALAHPAAPVARVTGARAVLEVCARAAVILLVAAVLLYAGYVVVERPTADDTIDAGSAAAIIAMMYGLHLAALLVLGWPGGVLTAHLLRHERSEARHVGAFALVGAALGAAVLLVAGLAGAAAVWAAVGGVTAGAARAWTGRARRARADRRDRHPSELRR